MTSNGVRAPRRKPRHRHPDSHLWAGCHGAGCLRGRGANDPGGLAANGSIAIGHLPSLILVRIRNPVVVPDDRRGQGVLHFGIAGGRRDISDQDSCDPDRTEGDTHVVLHRRSSCPEIALCHRGADVIARAARRPLHVVNICQGPGQERVGPSCCRSPQSSGARLGRRAIRTVWICPSATGGAQHRNAPRSHPALDPLHSTNRRTESGAPHPDTGWPSMPIGAARPA